MTRRLRIDDFFFSEQYNGGRFFFQNLAPKCFSCINLHLMTQDELPARAITQPIRTVLFVILKDAVAAELRHAHYDEGCGPLIDTKRLVGWRFYKRLNFRHPLRVLGDWQEGKKKDFHHRRTAEKSSSVKVRNAKTGESSSSCLIINGRGDLGTSFLLRHQNIFPRPLAHLNF